MTRDELFTVLTTEQNLSEKQANYVLDKGTYHVTPKRKKVVVDFKPEFYTNNDRLTDFSKDAPKNFKKSFPYYNTFSGWKKLGYKVKSGEKATKKCELMYKFGKTWKLTPTAVFSYKQVEELTEKVQETVKSPVKEEKAEVKAVKQTSKKSEKTSKPTAKKTSKKSSKKTANNSQKAVTKVTDSELVKASVKTGWITCNPKEKPSKSKARHNKNTKTETICDGVTMTIKDGVAHYNDVNNIITF